MRIEQTELAGVLLLVPEPFRDERGLFTRTFDAAIFDAAVGRAGAAAQFAQDSQSRSARGVVRGLHGRAGRGEAKLVRCAHGAVHDVLVDARPDSPTFGRSAAFRLDDETFAQLYVPPGLLHGFQALTATADVCYRIDRPHDPAEDLAVAHDDPDLALTWPLPVTVLSPRDRAAGSWRELLDSGRLGTGRTDANSAGADSPGTNGTTTDHPDADRLDTTTPDANHPDATYPGAGSLDAGYPGAGHLDTGYPVAGYPGAGHLDAGPGTGHFGTGHLSPRP